MATDFWGDSNGIFSSGFWNEQPGDPGASAAVNNAAPNPDQDFLEWLQSKFPEGTPLVYQGNQYTGTGDVESTSSVIESEPVTLENVANEGSGTSDKSETKESSTLENANNTGSGASEKETGTSDDYGWVTHLNEEDDSDTKKETSQYPNGMSQDEFNAMYEFALGMTEQGENAENGIWGCSFETIPLTIELIQGEIDDLKSQYKFLESRGDLSETVANNIQAKMAKKEAMVAQAQEQLDTLNAFIDNYASLYAPIEKEEQKNPTADKLAKLKEEYEQASEEYEQAFDDLSCAWQDLSLALQKAGMDCNTSAKSILSSDTSKYELSEEDKNYASKAAEAIVKSMTQGDFKGDNFALPVDTSAKEYGSYLIQIAPSKAGVGVSAYNVRVVSPKGEEIARGTVTVPTGWANGSWDIKDSKGNTVANGQSTSAFAQSVTKAFSSVAIADYENSKSTSSVPEEVRSAAQAVLDAESNADDKEAIQRAAYREYMDSTHLAATESNQDIMDRYARGEINAYQAAVALSNVKDSLWDYDYNSITSAINYDNFKDAAKIPGDTGRGKVGISSLISDLSPEGIFHPASATNISKDITSEFKGLNEIASKVDSIDINGDADVAQKELSEQITKLATVGKSTFESMIRDLLSEGGTLQDTRENKNLKQFSSDIFAIAQRIYDKTSYIEERTNSYGLGNLDEKSIKQNLGTITDKINELTERMPTYYSPGSDMGGIGSSGVTLDKNQVKALAEYTESIQCTKDAAIALMKSAAFNGAENVTGDKYSEAWKKEMAVQTVDNTKTMTKEQFLDKNTLKWTDYLAAGAKGTLGTMVALLGGAVTAINPALGLILIEAGSSAVGKAGLDISTKVSRSKSTNEEVMFGTNESGAVNVMNDIYNRSLEPANFGDAKSVGTYTNGMAGALEVIAGVMGFIENPASAVIAIKDGIENIKSAGSGGLSENTDNVIRNVYELGENIITWSNLNININDYMRTPDPNLIGISKDNVVTPSNNATINPNYATYGEATSDNYSALDNKYSGATEQAKNANLAKDYNAGMEENVNEAVSDKYVKVFKVMLDKEPDYIRKVLIAIPKNHSEREWN